MAVDRQRTAAGEQRGLRRNLRLWHVIGLSIGLMAPSMAISINPQGAIAAVGRAIPLSFTIALVGALLVAYGFSRLSQHFHHSGSVLGLVGATLGARSGVVAAWCLAGTYVLFAFLTAVTAGIYGTLFLQAVAIIDSDPSWLAYLIGAVVVVVSGALAAVPADRATDVILSFEGVTILLIVIAAAVVLIKLLGHSGPGHLGFTMSVFIPAKGTTTSNVFLGVVFGFLSFGGFEAAAALGGEAAWPRRDIPRAIVGTVVVIGLFYVVISAIEMMGFGTSKAGLDNFANSPALLGTLGQTYVAKWFGDLIIAGTVVSAFGCSMASCVGASRLIYSFARDGVSPNHAVARVSPRYGAPVVAVGVVVAVELVLEIVLGGLVGAAPLTVFAWSGTVSTFLILIAYGLVTVGAAAFLFVRPHLRGEPTKAYTAEIVLPLAGVALLLYTIYRNVVPYPSGSSAWLPVAAGIWLVIALVAVAVAPSFSRRLGEQMVTDEGFEVATSGDHVRRPATG
ncbi:MAG: APC family permease [Actinomycetota bacterium]|nr:APC family permease [Actinomycetota bacterium]